MANPNPPYKFQPGQSGNPGGRPKMKPWTEALRRALKLNEQGQSKDLDAMAHMVVKNALAGETDAIEEIANRIEGKVPQGNILMGDEDGGAVKFERVERVIVKADAANSNGGSVSGLPATRAV